MVDQKLLDAIKEYWNQGVNRDAIKKALMDSGWSEKDINKAFEKITGEKVEEKKVKEVIPSKEVTPSKDKKIFFIAGGVVLVLVLAVLAYLFLFKVGFSEDIPDDLVPLGKLKNFIEYRKESYNTLALNASSPLKEAIQNGRINLIMTNNRGTKIIDAIGIVVEDGQIVSTALKVENPSFDVKFTEKTFDKLMIPDYKSVFFESYAKGRVKIKAYGKENKDKLSLLSDFVQHFFIS